MPFNSALFALFFSVFFVLYWIVVRTQRQRVWLIGIGSLLFYAAWDVRFVPLLLGTALIDFYIARAIDRPACEQQRRRRLLAMSIVVNLGVLGFFKYTNFLIGSGYSLLELLGVHVKAPVLSIVLPAGISFYTFQSMSYTIDVYRRELRARQFPTEFVAAVSFFPHLVAGPIIRASTLLPQFERPLEADDRAVARGYLLIGAGLFKKSMADLLAGVADAYFSSGSPHGLLESWTGALAFTGQIYGDFSGYTDIAIGVALLLGIVLPPNFDLPYVASSPSDFWRRWHISLSTWLRDYLYISLGGNRTHRYRNLMATMLLGGLWHGARWTFVVWGAYHGVLLVVQHAWPRRSTPPSSGLRRGLGTVLTFYLVVIGWVFFRADTISRAFAVLREMHGSTTPSHFTWEAVLTFALTIVGLVIGHAVSAAATRLEGDVSPFFVAVRWCLVTFCFTFSLLIGEAGHAFIYFQF